jgi:flagellar biosynthetic protein FliR
MTATLWLVFARAVGFLARAPGFARIGVPPALRAGVAFALALAIAPSLPQGPQHDWATFLLALTSEALAGAAFGMVATLTAEAAGAAGRVLDDIIGLRASVPGVAVAPAGLGGLWTFAFTVAFFTLGGCDALVAAFAHSFSVVPLGSVLSGDLLRTAGIGFGLAFMRSALELSAPGLCVALCIHVGLVALARVVPRFSHLSVAYPAAYAGVLLAAFASLATLRSLAGAQ